MRWILQQRQHAHTSNSHTNTDSRRSSSHVRILQCFFPLAFLHQPEGQSSAMGTLTWLLLPPRFQDNVAPVGGVMVRYKWNVECPEERRRPGSGGEGMKGGFPLFIKYKGIFLKNKHQKHTKLNKINWWSIPTGYSSICHLNLINIKPSVCAVS